jgi:hypothetical protein
MGRDLAFYILSTNIHHDTSKLCFALEYELESNLEEWEYKIQYYRYFHPDMKDIMQEDYPTVH